jgi:undecaprenyl-diphosphatase
LGLLQGITEFLPVSSSGHLVLVPALLGWEIPGLTFDTVMHLGTLVAVIAYFWRDLWALLRAGLESLWRRRITSVEARLAWLLVVSAIPAALLGFFLEDIFSQWFASPRAVAGFLFVTAALLLLGDRLGRRTRGLGQMGWGTAMAMGLAQGLAIAPGLSRSGSTIAAGLFCGLKRDDAARFSFLMGVPIIAGAAGLQLLKAASAAGGKLDILPLAVGLVAAMGSGYLTIRCFLRYLRTRRLWPFALYCVVLGIVGLLFV